MSGPPIAEAPAPSCRSSGRRNAEGRSHLPFTAACTAGQRLGLLDLPRGNRSLHYEAYVDLDGARPASHRWRVHQPLAIRDRHTRSRGRVTASSSRSARAIGAFAPPCRLIDSRGFGMGERMAKPVSSVLDGLSQDERRILEVMAALGGPLSKTALLEWLGKLGARRSAGNAFMTRDVREALARLSQCELLLEAGKEFAVNDAIRHTVLAALHAGERLEPLAASIRLIEPLRPTNYWMADPEAMTRELSWALHTGLDAAVLEEFDRMYGRSSVGSRPALLVSAFGAKPPASGFARLPPVLRRDYLAAALELFEEGLFVLSDDVLDQLASLELDGKLAGGVACYHAMRGDRARLSTLGERQNNALACTCRALIALIDHDFSSARAHAREALDHTRTKTSKRIKGVEGHAGAWLALLLITDRDPSSHAYARVQLEVLHRDGSPLRSCLDWIDALVHAGEDAVPNVSKQLFRGGESWGRCLLFGLLAHFGGNALGGQAKQIAESYRDAATKLGFSWLAAELAALTDSPRAGSGLSALYAAEAPWQRRLRALELAIAGAAEKTASRGAASAERLIWTIQLHDGGYFEITARLQSRTSSGWSNGRQVSWKRLAEAPPSATYLSEHDRRVTRHIYLDRERMRYGSAPAFLLDPRAVLDLVGHPNVFVDGVPVQVVSAIPHLEVQARDGGFRLSLTPPSLLQYSVVCERDGRDRVLVHALDADQLAVVGVFAGAPIDLPREAEAQMQKTLARLAGTFSLASDHEVTGGEIEEVAADGRLRVRLRRSGVGLLARVCVVPLEAAAAFVPGHGSARLILQTSADAPRVCAVRDLEAERHALQSLYAACPTLRDAVGGGHEGKLDELEQCLELLCELRAAPDVLIEWPEGEPLVLAAERDVRNVRLKLTSAADWLGAEGSLEVDALTSLTLHDLLARAAAARGRFLALDDGRYLALTSKLRKTLDGMAALASVKQGRVSLHPLWLGVAGPRSHDDYAELRCDAQVTQLLERSRQAAQLQPVVPIGFDAQLRSYQREGFEWLCRLAHVRAGACLADDMGLGKTLQALALLLAEASRGPSLVVAPTTVCANWIAEARRFAPQLCVRALAGGERSATIEALGAFDVLVCSYGLLQQTLDPLAAKHFRVLILDEAQAIKNAATQRAQAAQQLVADIRIALTGTPVENHLGELWSIMHFLNPGLLGSAKAFEQKFGRPITRDGDPQAARVLKRLIRPFILRRRKSEVLEDLPAKTVITLRVEPSVAERALFGALRERALMKLRAASGGNGGETRIQLLAELTRLRRAACHPTLVAPEAQIASSKLEAFESLLSELREGGHRALVFSQFVDYLSLVRARLDQLGVTYQYLDGSSSVAARSRAVAAFQSGEGELFLISLKAGGFGLNLTAADYVVHLDPWWNPAVEEQASDRAHRIGQTRPVTIYRLVMQDSIEEKILALHAEKRDLADSLLEGTSTAGVLGLDQLIELLQGDVPVVERAGVGTALPG